MKWINTKVEFTWDSKKQKYIETDVQGYHYSGPIAECGGGCFIAGTKIQMPNGIKFIEDITVGDMVKSFDTGTSSVVNSKVTETFVHNDKQYMVINGVIKTTSIHPFYCNEEWVEAGNLSVGDKILHVDGLEHTIETIEKSDTPSTVYNFEVDGTHNYFADGYLVHNKEGSLLAISEGALVNISGSGSYVPHVDMSVGDTVVAASIVGLPDTDVVSEFLMWEYTGSNIASQISIVTSSIDAIAPSSHSMYLIFDVNNGVDGDLKITDNHPIMVYSGSNDEGQQGAWYFEYASEVEANMKFLSSSLEEVTINSITQYTASVTESFLRFDIEPYDVYFVDGVLIHN